MKKKRVEKAIGPFNGMQIRYDAGKQPDDTPVEVTICGEVRSTLQVTLKDLRRLWELHDDAFTEQIIVPEPNEIGCIATDEEMMSTGHFGGKIFIVDWIKMDGGKTEQQFEKWWQESGHELALEFAKDSGETPVAYEGLAECIKEICLKCWNWSN